MQPSDEHENEDHSDLLKICLIMEMKYIILHKIQRDGWNIVKNVLKIINSFRDLEKKRKSEKANICPIF